MNVKDAGDTIDRTDSKDIDICDKIHNRSSLRENLSEEAGDDDFEDGLDGMCSDFFCCYICPLTFTLQIGLFG